MIPGMPLLKFLIPFFKSGYLSGLFKRSHPSMSLNWKILRKFCCRSGLTKTVMLYWNIMKCCCVAIFLTRKSYKHRNHRTIKSFAAEVCKCLISREASDSAIRFRADNTSGVAKSSGEFTKLKKLLIWVKNDQQLIKLSKSLSDQKLLDSHSE